MSPGDVRPPLHQHFLLGAAVGWIVLFVLYILFAGSPSLNEAMVGAASASLACIWWACGGRRGGMRFSGWPGALRPVAGAVASLPAATVRVGRHLARTVIHGDIRGDLAGHVAFRRDGDSAWANADLPAERALGLIGASLAPDSYVLREHGGDGGIVEHALTGGEGRP